MDRIEKNDQVFSLSPAFKQGLRQRAFPLIERSLERLLCLHQLSEVYAAAQNDNSDHHFTGKALRALNVNYAVSSDDLRRIPAEGPVVVVANHPFGAVEGIVLASILLSVRPDTKIMANYLLERISEIRNLLILVDPFSAKDSAAKNIKPLKETIEWLRNDHLLAVFPSGEVAHIDLQKREICDPVWSETIARIIRVTEAPVLPVFFRGANGPLFQMLGIVHPRIRTAMLPRELLNKRGKSLQVVVGNVIPFRTLALYRTDRDMISYLRQRTHLLAHRRISSANAGEPTLPPTSSRHNRKEDSLRPHFRRLTRVTRERHFDSTKAKLEPIAPSQDLSLLRDDVRSLPLEQHLFCSGDFTVFHATANQIPNLLWEIGRQREITFRNTGEGTGRAFDIDEFDEHYVHLCAWDMDSDALVGAYRIGRTDEIIQRRGGKGLYTSTLFRYKPQFFSQLKPALELGRAFVRPEYQRSVQSLFCLWKGIGQYVLRNPQYRILFGPISISNTYESVSRQLMVEFLRGQDYDDHRAKLVTPRTPFQTRAIKGWGTTATTMVRDIDELSAVISDIENDEGNVPILLREYLKLGGRFLSFNIDHRFSDSLDGLIMVDLTNTDRRLLDRYMGEDGALAFLRYHSQCND